MDKLFRYDLLYWKGFPILFFSDTDGYSYISNHVRELADDVEEEFKVLGVPFPRMIGYISFYGAACQLKKRQIIYHGNLSKEDLLDIIVKPDKKNENL